MGRAIGMVAGLLLLAGAVYGQTPSMRSTAPKKVIEMDPLEVIGKVQKPHVFYVIERGELKYEGLPLERSLVKEVEESVKRPPF